MPRTPGATTKRKPLTKLQRAAMFAAHNGICVICKLEIDPRKPWIDEHIRALALGGGNELSNRGPAHFHCADVKTHEVDMPAIVKGKAQQAAYVGKDPDEPPAFKRPAKPPRETRAPVPGLSNIARRFRASP